MICTELGAYADDEYSKGDPEKAGREQKYINCCEGAADSGGPNVKTIVVPMSTTIIAAVVLLMGGVIVALVGYHEPDKSG